MSKQTALIWILVVTVAVTLAFASGCSIEADASGNDEGSSDGVETASQEKPDDGAKKKKKGADDEEKEEEAIPVEVAELELGPIESVLSFSSNLEAESAVTVISQAKRLITELKVEEGDRVQRDQVLLRLQDDEQRTALAKVKNELAKAEREYERQERLYKQELISEEEFNNATYEVEQLRIELEDAERELSYTEVRAPISGTVTSRMVNLGDQVQVGQELFEMVDFDSIVARVYVPEKFFDSLRSGMSARVSTQSEKGGYDCSVKRIAPVVDPQTGTVKVTVEVGRRAGLRPGMYVDVDLVTATHPSAVLVPKRALVYDNDQMYVYRLDQGKARVERVFIEPTLTDKYHVEPSEGLAAGDRIVVAGQAGLKDGALVELPGRENEASHDDVPVDEASVERASL